MNADTQASIQALVDAETRAGLLQVIRNVKATLSTGLPASSRVYYEALRDAAVTRLDAIMQAEGPAS